MMYMNLERSRSQGATFKLDWRSDPWFLNLAASWVKSENETREIGYSAFPRYIVDAEVGYEHRPWGTRFYLVQHWQLDSDDLFPPSAGIPALALPDYSRTDLGAIHALGERVSLMVTVRNLLDRDNFHPSNSGSRGGIPDLGRTLGAAVRFTF
jgi:outer membrane receptor for ferrienterochelin and colicin